MSKQVDLLQTADGTVGRLKELQQVTLVLMELFQSDLQGFSKYGHQINVEHFTSRLGLTEAMINTIHDIIRNITGELDAAVKMTYLEGKK